MKPTNGSITIVRPDTAGVSKVQNVMVERAKAITITGEDTHREAKELLVQIAKVRKDVIDLFDEPKASAYKTHKDICAAEKKLLTPCDAARAEVEKKLHAYEGEVRKKTEEAEAKMDLVRHQEGERERLAELAPDLAAALPPVEAPNTFVPGLAEVAGVSSRSIWQPEVHDLHALVSWIVLHPEWINLVEPNMSALRALANSQKDKFFMPGVRAVETKVTSVRS